MKNVYAYSPYGEVAVLGSDGGNDLQYGGLKNDGTGLYQAMYRYYDPILKQWISEDPIGLPGGINQRSYVDGNPIGSSDPEGLTPLGQGGVAPRPMAILAPGPLGIRGGDSAYRSYLDGQLTIEKAKQWLNEPYNKCMVTCDVMISLPCKPFAAVTPGAPWGPIATWGACNVIAHEVCSARCKNAGNETSCPRPWNSPANPDFPRIPPLANPTDRPAR